MAPAAHVGGPMAWREDFAEAGDTPKNRPFPETGDPQNDPKRMFWKILVIWWNTDDLGALPAILEDVQMITMGISQISEKSRVLD